MTDTSSVSSTTASSTTASSTTTVSSSTTPHTTTDTSTVTSLTALWSVDGTLTITLPSQIKGSDVEVQDISSEHVELVVQNVVADYTGADVSQVTVSNVQRIDRRLSVPLKRRLSTTFTKWSASYIAVGSGPGMVIAARNSLQQVFDDVLASSAQESMMMQSHFGAVFAQQGWEFNPGAYQGVVIGISGPEMWNFWNTTVTATTTTATTTTSGVCQLPYFGIVPVIDVSVAGPSDEDSGEPGILRIECEGKFPGNKCDPICRYGWENDTSDISRCSVPEDQPNGQYEGIASCMRKECAGSPEFPSADGSTAHCVDMKHEDVCTVICDSGYESSGVDSASGAGGEIQFNCDNTQYLRPAVSETWTCRRASCWEAAIPSMQHVSDSSVCIGTADGDSCEPVCEDGYVLSGVLECVLGVFFQPPETCIAETELVTLEDASVYEYDMAIVGPSLSKDWGESNLVSLSTALSEALQVNVEQVFVTKVSDLGSSWDSQLPGASVGSARRLSASEDASGLHLHFGVRPYPRDEWEDGGSALLARIQQVGDAGTEVGNTFLNELDTLLSDAGESVPDGLSTATLAVSEFSQSWNRTYPMRTARWEVQSTWGACSNGCGAGEEPRTVACLTGNEDLCNANAPDQWTKEGLGMDSTRPCKYYGGCDYTWTCPSGVDPETGICPGGEEEGVMASMGGSGLIMLCVALQYCRTRLRRPDGGCHTIKVDTDSKGLLRCKVKWVRHQEPDDAKSRVVWDLEGADFYRKYDFGHLRPSGNCKLVPFSAEEMRLRNKKVKVKKRKTFEADDSAALTESLDASQLLEYDIEHERMRVQENVDIDLSGEVSFALSVHIRTIKLNGFIVGKCWAGKKPAFVKGQPKQLVIVDGRLSLQVGDEILKGTTMINDGLDHEVCFGYDDDKGVYYLRVDDNAEVQGIEGPIPDATDTILMQGTDVEVSMGDISDLVALSDESLGFDIIQDIHPSGRPHFDGDIDVMLFEEATWDLEESKDVISMFFLYVHNRTGKRGNRRASDREGNQVAGDDDSPGLDTHEIVDYSEVSEVEEPGAIISKPGNDMLPFQSAAKLEYYSHTNHAWVPCEVESVNGYENATLAVRRHLIDGPGGSVADASESSTEKLPLYDVYVGLAHRVFYSTSMNHLRRVFTENENVSFFSVRGCRWLKAQVNGKPFDRATIVGYDISLDKEEIKDLKIKKKEKRKAAREMKHVPAQFLRPRFVRGDRVEVYRGITTGWQYAVVVEELPDVVPARRTTTASEKQRQEQEQHRQQTADDASNSGVSGESGSGVSNSVSQGASPVAIPKASAETQEQKKKADEDHARKVAQSNRWPVVRVQLRELIRETSGSGSTRSPKAEAEGNDDEDAGAGVGKFGDIEAGDTEDFPAWLLRRRR